ncbi:MAG: nuclear transport factor 2 family protein [Bacteroidota bacterium]
MKKQHLFLLVLAFVGFAEVRSQTVDNLRDINQVWEQFCLAFESLDHTLMQDIHSRELVRIAGGERISDYDTYVGGYLGRFARAKENGVSNKIVLRFFERINNDSVASERGIYQLKRTRNGSMQTYYGQFHVLFRKENKQWKIVMDYDSSEGDTIGEAQFLKAHAMDSLAPFLSKKNK